MWFLKIFELIPFVNNIVNRIGNYAEKKVDADLEKYKTNGQINIKAMETDVAVIQARTALAVARADDPADRLGRILLMWPTGVYVAVSMYWLTFGNKLPAWILVEPKPLDANMLYLLMAVIGYLLVTAWKGNKSA